MTSDSHKLMIQFFKIRFKNVHHNVKGKNNMYTILRNINFINLYAYYKIYYWN